MNSTVKPAWGVVVVAAVLAVPACAVSSASPGPARPEPALASLPLVKSYQDIHFPLDAYHPSPAEKTTLARAGDVLVRECMQHYGFDFPLPDRTTAAQPADRRIGLVDAAEAARFGYKPADFDEYAQRVDEAKHKQVKWPAEMLAVLDGTGAARVNGIDVPKGGCNVEARTRAGTAAAGEPGDENFVIRLEQEAGSQAGKDSRLQAAFAKWSECMAESGFTYRDPWQANNDRAFADGKPSTQMITTATADVACRTREKVNSTWVAVITAYQNRAITEHQDALAQHRQKIQSQLTTATQLLDK
ncbi:hypothetical protein [Amycolatopsis sp. RTGN1]|uniref:hypothetical protein n=1 Tax=Amycolatopsis ponsaeliensis TaxID=2992142 RepID=UPI00254AF62D|nr:hypothetical protein [Amycolatopsis sp. RTGN1]